MFFSYLLSLSAYLHIWDKLGFDHGQQLKGTDVGSSGFEYHSQ